MHRHGKAQAVFSRDRAQNADQVLFRPDVHRVPRLDLRIPGVEIAVVVDHEGEVLSPRRAGKAASGVPGPRSGFPGIWHRSLVAELGRVPIVLDMELVMRGSLDVGIMPGVPIALFRNALRVSSEPRYRTSHRGTTPGHSYCFNDPHDAWNGPGAISYLSGAEPRPPPVWLAHPCRRVRTLPPQTLQNRFSWCGSFRSLPSFHPTSRFDRGLPDRLPLQRLLVFNPDDVQQQVVGVEDLTTTGSGTPAFRTGESVIRFSPSLRSWNNRGPLRNANGKLLGVELDFGGDTQDRHHVLLRARRAGSQYRPHHRTSVRSTVGVLPSAASSLPLSMSNTWWSAGLRIFSTGPL